MAIKIETLFPTSIALGKLPESRKLNPQLLQDVEDFRAQDKMGREWSEKNYLGGYTSYASLSDMHFRSPAFQDFASAMQPQVEAFARSQNWEMRGMRLEMTACWFNVMPKGTYHPLHLHPHSVVSGAYYLTAPKGSVSLKIEDPRMAFFMNAPLKRTATPKDRLYYEVKPAEGTFVLFESWLRHEVPPNQSQSPRISISFNYSLESED